MEQTARMVTHRCAIEECPIEIPFMQLMCAGHWRLVPKPIQRDLYTLARKRRGSPAHRETIQRAIAAARKTLDGWAQHRAEAQQTAEPGWLPYRDD